MFLLEFEVDEVKREASKLLKNIGVKHRFKKFDVKIGNDSKETGVFKVRLENLQKRKVKLPQYDHLVNVPAFLVDACSFLRCRLETDGIFRKPGVAARQKEIRQQLLIKGDVIASNELSVSDVADLLKQFFRELPEPCIPYVFHELLQRCMDSKIHYKDAVLVAILLLPIDYLFSLAYLMEFLQEVAAHHKSNRMDVCNLAIVWTPNLMPFKTGQVDDKHVISKRLSIVQVLIEHSTRIGVVPDCICEHLSSFTPSCSLTSHDELEISRQKDKKKKRRSGSLTRMISGIKKMVRRSSSQERLNTPEQVTATAHTPRIVTTGKKRKANEPSHLSQSAKKRRDLLKSLPQKSLLPDVCTHLTPRVLVTQPFTSNRCMEEAEPKPRSRFYTSRTPERSKERKSYRSLSGTKLRLSHFGLGRKHRKKTAMTEDSVSEITATPNKLDTTNSSEDYVRISRSEYEDIKNRVSQIESRISSEFENIVGVSMSDLEMTPDKSIRNNVDTVQCVYEKTLESAEKLNSSASDELARRLSKELKIREGLENKVMRSPSARKIGTLRRRSKENIPIIKRNLSFNMLDRRNAHLQFYPQNSLQRGKPNTVYNGLPGPMMAFEEKSKRHSNDFTSSFKSETFNYQSVEPNDFDFNSFGVLTRSQARRTSSFHGYCLSNSGQKDGQHSKIGMENSLVDATNWKSADNFLKDEKVEQNPVTGRPSLAKIRSQNAGMVLAKAKLFSTMVDTGEQNGMRAFKTVKSCNDKSQTLKKRNSSKSSKERKLQKADSKKKEEQSESKLSAEAPTNTPKKLQAHAVVKFDKVNRSAQKENLNKTSVRALHNSLSKTTFDDSKVTQSSFSPAKQSKLKVTPLRENHRNVNSPHNSASKKFVKSSALHSRSPNVAHHILSKTGASPMRKISSTPRRSPRTLMLKSRHVNKM